VITLNQGTHTMSRTPLFAALALAAVMPSMAMADDSQSSGIDWRVTPMYLWLPSVKTDLTSDAPPLPSSSNESSFSDIVSKIDWVVTGHVEGQGENFGLMGDISYLALSDQTTHPAFETEASVDVTVFELAGVWSPGDTAYEGFEGFAGTRYLKAKLDAKFTPTNPALPSARRILSKSYADFMIGGRYTAKLSDRWSLVLRGDGSFGDTEGTYNVGATLQWHRSDKGFWDFGYKYMNIKLKGPGDSLNITQYGPTFAYTFAF
jgi:hypothetical protein